MLWALRRWLRKDTQPARGRELGRGRGRRSRPVGCMIWVIAIFVALLVLSILFGGFHQGHKNSGLARSPAPAASVSLAPAAGRLVG